MGKAKVPGGGGISRIVNGTVVELIGRRDIPARAFVQDYNFTSGMASDIGGSTNSEGEPSGIVMHGNIAVVAKAQNTSKGAYYPGNPFIKTYILDDINFREIQTYNDAITCDGSYTEWYSLIIHQISESRIIVEYKKRNYRGDHRAYDYTGGMSVFDISNSGAITIVKKDIKIPSLPSTYSYFGWVASPKVPGTIFCVMFKYQSSGMAYQKYVLDSSNELNASGSVLSVSMSAYLTDTGSLNVKHIGHGFAAILVSGYEYISDITNGFKVIWNARDGYVTPDAFTARSSSSIVAARIKGSSPITIGVVEISKNSQGAWVKGTEYIVNTTITSGESSQGVFIGTWGIDRIGGVCGKANGYPYNIQFFYLDVVNGAIESANMRATKDYWGWMRHCDVLGTNSKIAFWEVIHTMTNGNVINGQSQMYKVGSEGVMDISTSGISGISIQKLSPNKKGKVIVLNQ